MSYKAHRRALKCNARSASLKILMEGIHQFEGTINQFTGDGVMALFGAPVAHEDHGQRACDAALSIQETMGKYGDQLKKEYGIGG